MDRGGAVRERDFVPPDELGRRRCGPRLHQHRGRPGEQRRVHADDDPADVGERERDERDVVGHHVRLLGVTNRAGEHRAVGVLRALGVGRGARRVEDPPHRVLRGIVEHRRRRRQRGRVAVGIEMVCDERVHVVALAGHLLRQRLIVELVPYRRRDQQLAARLLRDERDLAVAVDREHRILDRAQPAQRADQHGRLRPGRELPRDVRPRGHAECVQPRGRTFAEVAVLRERGRTVAVVQHDAVGSCPRSPLDELPHAAGVVDHRFRRPTHTVMPPSMETIEPVM